MFLLFYNINKFQQYSLRNICFCEKKLLKKNLIVLKIVLLNVNFSKSVFVYDKNKRMKLLSNWNNFLGNTSKVIKM